MREIKTGWLRQLFLFGVLMISIAGIVSCSSSSSSSDDSSSAFPTPTLPANATIFTGANANSVADSAITFASILPTIAGKSAASVSTSDVVKIAIKPLVRNERYYPPGTAAIDPEVVCEIGTFTDTITDNGSVIEGSVTYDECNFFNLGVFVNGVISVFETYDEVAGTYNFQIGGTLTISDGTDTVTVVLNLTESGNENTGDFTDNVSFSIAGVPDETYLVTTTQAIVGNYFTGVYTSGQMLVSGGANTRLRLDVVPGNLVEVYLDNGTGTFVFHSNINL